MDGKQSFLDTDFTKAFSGLNLPGFDAEAALASQRKNIEALTQANQLAVDGAQAVARRQVEIARETIEEASTLFRDLAQPISSEDRVAKNAAIFKSSFERGLANARELALMLTKANTEAFEVVVKRFTEGFDEIRSQAKTVAR